MARAPRFSVSSTTAYETCPRRYRFGYLDRVKVDRGLAPQHWRFGSVVHAGLEAAYKRHREAGTDDRLDHAVPVALEAVRASWVSEAMPDDPAELTRAETIVADDLAATRLAPRDILGVEHWFTTKTDDGLTVGGAADLVVRADRTTVEIRDHKVTTHTRSAEQLAGDFQLGVYGWFALRTWPWAEQVVVAHHYPITRELVRIPLDDAWIGRSMERLQGVAHLTLADADFAPVPGDHCSNCVYIDLCDAAVRPS